MKKNEFLDLVSSPLMNLDHIYRYSGTKLVEDESLSQHIVDTIMLGLKIIDNINYVEGHEVVNPNVYVMKAVYHDLEEAITGDIPRPLKYYNEDTQSSMKKVAEEVAFDLFRQQFWKVKDHYDIWNQAKEDPEGHILKVVDTLVVVYKVVKEVSLLNNYYMLRVAHEVLQYLKELRDIVVSNKEGYFSGEGIIYIDRVLTDARKTIENILSKNKVIMDELNINSLSMI